MIGNFLSLNKRKDGDSQSDESSNFDHSEKEISSETRINSPFGSQKNSIGFRKKSVEIDYTNLKRLQEIPFNDIRIAIDWPGKKPINDDPDASKHKPSVSRPQAFFTPENLTSANFRNQYLPEKFENDIVEIENRIFQIKKQKGENKFSRPGRKSYMDGIISYEHLRLRYALSMTAQGELWAILRSIPPIIPPIDDLGAHRDAIADIKRLSLEKDGLIIFAGSTGAGKTTTMISAVQHMLYETGGLVYTIEDPCEYLIHGPHGSNGYCLQTEMEDHGSWTSAISTALRSKPDCLVLGEIRENEVAKMAIRFAQSGHLVKSTLHAGSITDALNSIVRLSEGSDSQSIKYQVTQRLKAIIYQERDGEKTKIRILDFTDENVKKDLIPYILNDKTSNVDKDWVKKYGTDKDPDPIED